MSEKGRREGMVVGVGEWKEGRSLCRKTLVDLPVVSLSDVAAEGVLEPSRAVVRALRTV